ncbi:DUF3349 domain-containing protein [Mycolicibacterium llatzerense]|uniref:DUF3349 domain-containing protein n=1 Tax=Mycolicibacterium llatzerense TaxID=280871 RepID=UPI0008DCA864|nr:DUF3349 domain-containing protein [Mycolicibacterium llatzerense]
MTHHSPAAHRWLHLLQSLHDWLRAGYPSEAPSHGYSPLLALNGPASLSARQTRQVLAQLHLDATGIDIAVAITHATGQLPTASQTHAIEQRLRRRRS